jgi:hypothetical protein
MESPFPTGDFPPFLASPEYAKDFLHQLAHHSASVRIAIDTGHHQGWSDEVTFAVLACHQAMIIQRLSDENMTLRMLQPTVILGPGMGERKEIFPERKSK